MKKSPSLVALLLSLFTAAAGVQACAGGMTSESDAGASGSGGSSVQGSGGQVTTGSGGRAAGSGGQVTTGSGGAVTTGSGGAVTTGSGGAGSSVSCGTSPDHAGAANGYVTAAPWMGYAYTFGPAGSVQPVCGASATCYANSMKKLCAMGTVPMDTTFSASSGFGWNIAQASGSMTPMTAVPTGTGLTINAPGAAANMRVQLNNGSGTSAGRWCAPMPAGGSGTIPWASFKTECWGTSGTAYAMNPIVAVEIVVPSSDTAATPFCFCVTSISGG
jgi:hypothetical protein